MSISSVAVYCFENGVTADLENTGSEDHLAAAILLGEEFAKRGITLITGGMSGGLMGVVTNAALQAGGRVIGIIPKDFPDENRHPRLSDVHIVDDALERKRLMMQLSDASVTLPGGYGTCSELMHELDIRKEIAKGYASAERYGVSENRPVVIYDPDRFYAPLAALAENMGKAKRNIKDSGMLKIASNIRQVLLELGVISSEEYRRIYDAHSRELGVSSNAAIDSALKPISPTTRKRDVKHARALMAGGLVGLVLACSAPRIMPGATDLTSAGSQIVTPSERRSPLTEVNLRMVIPKDVEFVQLGGLPDKLPEYEREIFKEMARQATEPKPSVPTAVANDITIFGSLLALWTLLTGDFKAQKAQKRPAIVVPKLVV